MCTDTNKAPIPRNVIQLCIFVLVLVMLQACTVLPVQPLYEPLPQSPNRGVLRQGYFDYQIDDRTYFIGYFNYHNAFLYFGNDLSDRSEKCLKGAQEYVLYRASELTKSKGQRSFIVLYQDDWLYTGYVRPSYRVSRHFKMSPGAWVIVRVLDENPAVGFKSNSLVYSPDTLQEVLVQENRGLGEYHRTTVSPDRQSQYGPRGFNRWRSLSSAYDAVPVPGVPHEGVWRGTGIDFESGSKVTQTAPGRYTIAVWQENIISPIDMLSQCIALADREGFKAFRLQNWTTEEHIGRTFSHYGSKVWFRNTVDVVLQEQGDPVSLDPVFVVDEIRPGLSKAVVPLP